MGTDKSNRKYGEAEGQAGTPTKNAINSTSLSSPSIIVSSSSAPPIVCAPWISQRLLSWCRGARNRLRVRQSALFQSMMGHKTAQTKRSQHASPSAVAKKPKLMGGMPEAAHGEGSSGDRAAKASQWRRGKEKWKDCWTKTEWKSADGKEAHDRSWAYCVPDDETGEPVIKCAVCQAVRCENVLGKHGSKTIRFTTLTNHEKGETGEQHRKAVKSQLNYKAIADQLRQSMDKILSKAHTSVPNLIRNVYFLAKEDTTFSKLESMVQCDIGKGIEYQKDKKGNVMYSNPRVAREFVMALSTVLKGEQWKDVVASPVLSVMVDETTDIATQENLTIYLIYIKDGEATCQYSGILLQDDTTVAQQG